MIKISSDCLFDSSWLNKPILQIDMDTGEVIAEYATVIDACREKRITPVKLFHSIISNVDSAHNYNWLIPQ